MSVGWRTAASLRAVGVTFHPGEESMTEANYPVAAAAPILDLERRALRAFL
jgi:hypothetical protein